jgi:hypothetical protein
MITAANAVPVLAAPQGALGTARRVPNCAVQFHETPLPRLLPTRWASDRLTLLCVALLLLCALTGCVSKAKAKAQAQAAFAAGQQQAMIRMHQNSVPNVSVQGAVSNPFIPWTEDLTVAKAIVAAGYHGAKDPVEIIIVRRSQATRVDPKQLLTGNDPPLQSGDILVLR